MKTVEEYILEKQNFIFGGKAGLTGKEYGTDIKTFEELEKGDYLYYWNFADGGSKMTLRLGFRCRITYINKSSWHNITIKYVAEEGNEKYLDSDILYVYAKKRNNSMTLLSDFDDVNAVEIMTTYEDTPERILATAKEMWDEIIANESANFVFGGKSGLTGKEYGEGHTLFGELKSGDTIYKYNVSKGIITEDFGCKLERISKFKGSAIIHYLEGRIKCDIAIGEYKDIEKALNSSIIIKNINNYYNNYYYFISTYELEQEKIDELIEKFENDDFEKSRTRFEFDVSYII